MLPYFCVMDKTSYASMGPSMLYCELLKRCGLSVQGQEEFRFHTAVFHLETE